MKTTLMGMAMTLATAATVVMPAPAVHAQGMGGPAIVVGMAPIKEQLADIGYITKAAGQAEAGGLVNLLAGEYVRPLDQNRPMGAYVSLEQGMPMVVVFLPVKDMDGLIELVSDQFAEPEEEGEYKVFPSPDGDSVYVIQRGDWAFVSNMKEALSSTPDDPSEWLADLEEYNISVRVNGQNIPQPLKEMAIGAMEEGFEGMLAELEQVDPDQAELQRQLNGASLDSMADMINEMDEFTLGWSIDAQMSGTYLDFIFTGIEGSKMAESVARIEGAESSFLGFMMEDAAINLNMISMMGPDEIVQAVTMLESISDKAIDDLDEDPNMNPMEKELAVSLITSCVDVLTATIDSGKIDGGMSVVLDDDTAALVAGVYALKTKKLENAIKDLVATVEGDAPPGVEFNLDLRKVDGINYHQIIIPIPEFEDEARLLFGDKMELWLGIGKKAIYLAAGSNAEDTLKDAIEASKNAEASEYYTQGQVDLAKLINFAAKMDENEPQLQMMAEMLEGKEAKITMTAEVIENGAKSRVMIEEGFISAIGEAIDQAMNAFGGGGAQF